MDNSFFVQYGVANLIKSILQSFLINKYLSNTSSACNECHVTCLLITCISEYCTIMYFLGIRTHLLCGAMIFKIMDFILPQNLTLFFLRN